MSEKQNYTIAQWFQALATGFQNAGNALESRIAALEKRIEDIEKRQGIAKEDTSASVTETEDSGHKIAFLPGPTSLGIFDNAYASPKFMEGVSLYRFEKRDGKRASVYVENRPCVVKAFHNDPSSQYSACERTDKYFPKATGIKTINPGEATFDGEKWRIDRKVEIEYVV